MDPGLLHKVRLSMIELLVVADVVLVIVVMRRKVGVVVLVLLVLRLRGWHGLDLVHDGLQATKHLFQYVAHDRPPWCLISLCSLGERIKNCMCIVYVKEESTC